MIAADTNVLIRLLTRDDPDQTERVVRALDAAGEVLVSLPTCLEVSWVLARTYAFDREAVAAAIGALRQVSRFVFEDAARVDDALRLATRGIDFPDALHLASARGCESLLSFDRRFARRVAGLGETPPVRQP